MKLRHHIIKSLLVITACISLTGCETVEQSMASMQDRINRINFKMPVFTAKKENMVSEAQAEEQAEAPDMKSVIPSSEAILAKGENCPDVTIVKELNRLHQFSSTSSTSAMDRVSAINLSDVVSGCRYNENNIIVEMNLRFEGQIGPKGRVVSSDEPRFSYPYFIAIASSSGEILAKEIFSANISYEANESTAVHEEHVSQIIPLTGKELGAKYSVLMGFQLTEAQLAYNRANANKAAENGILFAPSHVEAASGVNPYAETPYDTPAYDDDAPSQAPVNITAPVEE